MKIIDHKEDALNIYLDGLKRCIKEAGLVYKEGYNDPMSGDIPDRIKYISLFGIGRSLATISHYNPVSKRPLALSLENGRGEQDLVKLAETIEKKLGIGVVVYK